MIFYYKQIESLTASTSGIDLSDLNETIKETPELINFNDPNLWQSTHDFLKAEGFSPNRFLSMISKYPNVMYKSNDTLQKSMVSWRACQFGEKNVIELLETYPQLLEITDEPELIFKTLEFQNYVGNRKNVWRLYMNSPNIIYDKLKISEAKFNYLQNVMKVDASEIVKSAVFSLNLDVIKCRHIFLERLGSYKIRSEKENAAEPSRNPNLSQIMDTSEKRFAVKVAFVTLEEFQAFQDLYNRELNTYSSMEDDYDEIDDNNNAAEFDVPARLPRKIYSKGKR